MGGIRGLLIVALAVAAVLAQPVSADAKGKGQNKGVARLHGGASAQDILRTPGDARAIRVIRRDRRGDAKTVRKIDSHRRDRDRKVRIVDNKFNHVDRFFGLPLLGHVCPSRMENAADRECGASVKKALMLSPKIQ